MKVNIVAKRWDSSDRILPRLAKSLADMNGWSISEKWRADVDINYAIVYLSGFGDDPENVTTLKGAWFSHYPLSGKRRKWMMMQKACDFRTTCVDEYYTMLSAYGPTYRVIPGIDQTTFSPAKGRRPHPPNYLLGTAGFVTEGDRKGPDLAKAVYDKYGERFQTVGRGWWHPSTLIPGHALPSFYRDIEIYVCTSRVEGIPIPPLEALACGCKVVLPRGVGILDYFGEQPGVRYYDMGVPRDMFRAIELCESDPVDRLRMRSLVSLFTYEAWAETHRIAIEKIAVYL